MIEALMLRGDDFFIELGKESGGKTLSGFGVLVQTDIIGCSESSLQLL